MSMSYVHLETKVRDIVNSCRSVNTLHPVVSELCQLPEFKQIFWNSLNQDFYVICQRSQVLAHGEITVIQKAFTILMEKKEDIIAAIELYVDEILGLKFTSETERATTLNTMIQTRHSILSQSNGSEPSFASRANDGDEKLKRLFIVYHKARQDFDTTKAKTLERTQSAKFLRDTTENCLAYIAAKRTQSGVEATCDGVLLDELRVTLEETIAIVEQGSGGKKRRFDEDWENVPQGPGRMRGAQPLRNADPVPRGRTSERKRRPSTSRTQPQGLLEADYPKQRMYLAERRRSDLPYKRYHSSAGQSVRDVFGDRCNPHAERTSSSVHAHAHGDRYRPRY